MEQVALLKELQNQLEIKSIFLGREEFTKHLEGLVEERCASVVSKGAEGKKAARVLTTLLALTEENRFQINPAARLKLILKAAALFAEQRMIANLELLASTALATCVSCDPSTQFNFLSKMFYLLKKVGIKRHALEEALARVEEGMLREGRKRIGLATAEQFSPLPRRAAKAQTKRIWLSKSRMVQAQKTKRLSELKLNKLSTNFVVEKVHEVAHCYRRVRTFVRQKRQQDSLAQSRSIEPKQCVVTREEESQLEADLQDKLSARLARFFRTEKQQVKVSKLEPYIQAYCEWKSYALLQESARLFVAKVERAGKEGWEYECRLMENKVDESYWVEVQIFEEGRLIASESKKLMREWYEALRLGCSYPLNYYFTYCPLDREIKFFLNFLEDTENIKRVVELQKHVRWYCSRIKRRMLNKQFKVQHAEVFEDQNVKFLFSVIKKGPEEYIHYIESIDYPRPRVYRVFHKAALHWVDLHHVEKYIFVPEKCWFIEVEYYERHISEIKVIQRKYKRQLQKGLVKFADSDFSVKRTEVYLDAPEPFIASYLSRSSPAEDRVFVESLWRKGRFVFKVLSKKEQLIFSNEKYRLIDCIDYDFKQRTIRISFSKKPIKECRIEIAQLLLYPLSYDSSMLNGIKILKKNLRQITVSRSKKALCGSDGQLEGPEDPPARKCLTTLTGAGQSEPQLEDSSKQAESMNELAVSRVSSLQYLEAQCSEFKA